MLNGRLSLELNGRRSSLVPQPNVGICLAVTRNGHFQAIELQYCKCLGGLPVVISD